MTGLAKLRGTQHTAMAFSHQHVPEAWNSKPLQEGFGIQVRD